MIEEEACPGLLTQRSYRRLKLSLIEQTLIGAMLFTLTIAIIDASDGQQIGKSDALAIAKQQGQQELMAARLK